MEPEAKKKKKGGKYGKISILHYPCVISLYILNQRKNRSLCFLFHSRAALSSLSLQRFASFFGAAAVSFGHHIGCFAN